MGKHKKSHDTHIYVQMNVYAINPQDKPCTPSATKAAARLQVYAAP